MQFCGQTRPSGFAKQTALSGDHLNFNDAEHQCITLQQIRDLELVDSAELKEYTWVLDLRHVKGPGADAPGPALEPVHKSATNPVSLVICVRLEPITPNPTLSERC